MEGRQVMNFVPLNFVPRSAPAATNRELSTD